MGYSKVHFEFKNPVTKVVYKVSDVKSGAKIARRQLDQNMWTRSFRIRSTR